jgi:hypothetical protein
VNSNILISLTSIPRRLDGSLLDVLATLKRQSLKCKILVNIPHSYRKWGAVGSIPTRLQDIEDVIISSPKTDYGPATKLLGALEYIQNRPEVEHIITVDDDMLLPDVDHLRYLSEFASVFPEFAVTFGGVKLKHFPFKSDDGLIYDNRFKFVDVPAGYRSVLYPTKVLRNSRIPFEFFDKLPPGIFHDDDAYFGIVLSVLNIPLFAIPKRPGGMSTKTSKHEGGSAVTELVDKDRAQNEMEIFQYAVSQGYFLGVNEVPPRHLHLRQHLGLATIAIKEFFRRVFTKLRRLSYSFGLRRDAPNA